MSDSISRGRTESRLMTDDPQKALMLLKLTNNSHITNAARILFCKDAESDYPQSLIRLFKFKGTDKSQPVDSRRTYGNAFAVINEAEAFMMRHMIVSSELVPGKMARLDHPEYSLKAVREAVINAVCHRDYTLSGGSISMMFYDDRLEITSHGTLPKGISVDELKESHESVPRNEKIVNVMYKRGFIESAGSGTADMVKWAREIGSPDPEYIERGSTFVVKFSSNPKVQIQDVAPELTERQHEILTILSNVESCSSSAILAKMVNPPTNRTLRSDLVKLHESGLIIRMGEGAGTVWKSRP